MQSKFVQQGKVVILNIVGNPSTELNSFAIDSVETYLSKVGTTRATSKKVMRVLIECMQNLYHHHFPLTEDNATALQVGKVGEDYYVKTGNYISRQHVKDLDNQLNELLSKTPEELTVLHRNMLSDSPRTRKGAGLGLISLIRQSGNHITHKFIRISNELNYFSLEVLITS